MITSRQRDVLTIARARLGLDEAAFDGLVREWGGQLVPGDLRPAEYDRLLDRLVTMGFTEPEYVATVRRDYTDVIAKWVAWAFVGQAERAFVALLVSAGAAGPHAMTGAQFHRLAQALLTLGVPEAELMRDLARNEVSPNQLALLHVALRDTDLTESTYRSALQNYGGVITDASDLDEIGFRRMLVFFEGYGFVPPSRRAKPVKRATFGRRAGMASPAQITLIRELWAEWSGADNEDALNAWLERFHHLSSLRFLTAEVAGKVITGLRAMKRRPKKAAQAS